MGDFFTKVNPHPRYIYDVINTLSEVSDAGIQSIIVGGNHEAPRLSTTLNPLKLLEHINKVHVILEPRTVSVDGIDFVCVPAPSNFDEIASLFNSMLQTAQSSAGATTRVLAAHLPLAQSRTSAERSLESFMGESVDVRQIPDNFVYVALGHVHRFQKIDFGTHPIYYSGSSERTDWSEEGEAKYVAEVEINGNDAEVRPVELPVRSMKTLVDEDCENLSGAQITELIHRAAKAERSSLSGAIIRIKLENVDHDESRRIDWEEIEKTLLGYGVFDYKPQARTTISFTESIETRGQYVFPPTKEFEFYVSGRKKYSGNTKDLKRLAEEIIKEAKERH